MSDEWFGRGNTSRPRMSVQAQFAFVACSCVQFHSPICRTSSCEYPVGGLPHVEAYAEFPHPWMVPSAT